ncbi:MAG TPA: hypothetical protein ENI17_12200 [Pseudomonas xinjiangensis]|uniref:Single Cache domain-containing protein n=2 Tax=root TaxID=1 RepID=A0A7V1BQ47_9GAMM|nr:hypothetical protein [Halopseudomonas xinjiangensis]HEC48373.1 hypothetical protein [Halopseudomonas xinjiangensis]
MLRSRFNSVVRAVAITVLIAPITAFAGPKEDAVDMVDRAYDFWHTHGREAAIQAFHDPNGEFIKGDLYIWVSTGDGVIIAHGGTPALAGKNLGGMKLPDGRKFVEEVQKATSTDGQGWVSYTWTHPVTRKPGMKMTYVRDLSPDRTAVGVGIYVEE